jgi:hypothetical protein
MAFVTFIRAASRFPFHDTAIKCKTDVKLDHPELMKLQASITKQRDILDQPMNMRDFTRRDSVARFPRWSRNLCMEDQFPK